MTMRASNKEILFFFCVGIASPFILLIGIIWIIWAALKALVGR
jgi:hypothetical protein